MVEEKQNLKIEAAAVLFFSFLIALSGLGQALHMDEPFFLVVGAHLLKAPLHPFNFSFNWYGQTVLYAKLNNTPPLFHYLLALGLEISKGKLWLLRALFMPLDLLSALFLYLIAANFLKRPLWPTLITLASPAYLINLPHLMPEKLMAVFSFLCLYALIRAFEDQNEIWYWISALALNFALLSKYAALFLLFPALSYSLHYKKPFLKTISYFLISIAGLLLYFLYDRLTNHAVLSAVAGVFATPNIALLPFHKTRSFLSFTGGLGIAATLWPLLFLKKNFKAHILCLTGALLLFLPFFDTPHAVISIFERGLGIFFSYLAFISFLELFSARALKGWPLWMSWFFAAGLLQLTLYWSIAARIFIFILPPLILGLAEKMESRLKGKTLRMIMIASFFLTLSLSLALRQVDFAYASSQKKFSHWVKDRYIARGKKVWFTGHWGFQYYMEKAGAAEENWPPQKMKTGDIFITPTINTNLMLPFPLTNRLKWIDEVTIQNPFPLRLMGSSAVPNEAGFYSSVFGFLPYTLSSVPLDKFLVFQIQKIPKTAK